MTDPLIEDLLAAGPVVTDGAWGTQLLARGLAPRERADLWNLRHPDRVEAVARGYVDAGSRVILTNTFQANRMALGEAGVETVAINRAGVEISRRAAGSTVKVFASIGPSNKLLITGDVTEGELAEVFTEQAVALADAGADALVIETMSDIDEARIAVESAAGTGRPVVACMTYDTGKRKNRTMTGVLPDDAAKILADAGADVIGANCGAGIDVVAPVCEALAEATELPVWIKANAGMPDLIGTEVVYQMTPEQFAEHARRLVDLGADFVGGCCGTTPEFIAALVRAVADR